MKKRQIGIIVGIAAVVALGSFVSWYSAHKVDARELAIFHAFFQPVDAETKEILNVTVQSPTPELSKITGDNGQGAVPIVLEMRPGGPIRVSWVDLKHSSASIVLKAEGYAALSLPPDLVTVTVYFDSLAGSRQPDEVSMNKTQPDEGDNSE